jgi:hypothetical protein
MVHVLAETYANCVDQTSARQFYAVAAAENLLVYGADVSSTFAEAPPPKQGFFIRPDGAFNKWWVNHKQLPLFLPCRVIQNPHVSGRNMPTKFSGKLDPLRQFTNHASIQALLMDNGYSLCDRSMTSLSLRQMQKHLTPSWT